MFGEKVCFTSKEKWCFLASNVTVAFQKWMLSKNHSHSLYPKRSSSQFSIIYKSHFLLTHLKKANLPFGTLSPFLSSPLWPRLRFSLKKKMPKRREKRRERQEKRRTLTMYSNQRTADIVFLHSSMMMRWCECLKLLNEPFTSRLWRRWNMCVFIGIGLLLYE